MKITTALALGALMAGSAMSADAAVVVLNFEGINATYPSGAATIGDFYNGGTSSDGTSGTNYGVSFSSNARAICLNSLEVRCSNTSRGGLANGSDKGGLFFLDGDETFLNYSAGFSDGFSFFYAKPNDLAAAVNVYSGLNGTGDVLGTINLSATTSNCPEYGAGYCPFVAIGVNFDGTAQSIGFGGTANFVVFDDVTFGSSVPVSPGIPEPATWGMMILGFGAVGFAARRRRVSGRVIFD